MILRNKTNTSFANQDAKEQRATDNAIALSPCAMRQFAIRKVHMTSSRAYPLPHANAIARIAFCSNDETSRRIWNVLFHHSLIVGKPTCAKQYTSFCFNVIRLAFLFGLDTYYAPCFGMHYQMFGRRFVEHFRPKVFYSLLQGRKKARSVFCTRKRPLEAIRQSLDPMTMGDSLARLCIIKAEFITRARQPSTIVFFLRPGRIIPWLKDNTHRVHEPAIQVKGLVSHNPAMLFTHSWTCRCHQILVVIVRRFIEAGSFLERRSTAHIY